MFIQGNYNFSGIEISDAIGYVVNLRFRDHTEMFFQLPIYATAAQVEASQPLAVASYFCPYDPAAGGVYAQCYTYLLTLPEYDGWVEIP